VRTANNKLYEEFFNLKDIVKELPLIFEKFYSDASLRTCKNCGTVMNRLKLRALPNQPESSYTLLV
jgi:hypothetical protein